MSFIKSFILNTFRKAGYEILKPHSPQSGNSMRAGLGRLLLNNIRPGTIIDVGAASGQWTRMALNYWPGAQYHLIEPLQEQKSALQALRVSNPNINYHFGVAGAKTGEVSFNISPDLDGSGIYDEAAPDARKVPVLRIDDIAGQTKAPYLIKLDTHGYEMPILEGAGNTLEKTIALIIEVYGFHVSPTCLLWHELSQKIDFLGFKLIDVVEIMRRQKDNAFWQADAIYIKKDHPLFADKNYE
jgi:FkbM family methyltransferase